MSNTSLLSSRVPLSHLPARNIKALSYAVSACLSLGLGYYLGAHFGSKNVPLVVPIETKPELEPAPEDSDNEDDGFADGDLSSVKPRTMEPCKLVSACRRSGVDLSYDDGLHSGVDRADRFGDDSRKDRGAVRDRFLCTDVALSCSGVGMSRTLAERPLCCTYNFSVTRPWHVIRHS